MKALSKKEKLLAAAQKNLLKGQIGKAIKEYEKIVEVDAKDIRNRQKLAELYSRDQRPDEALKTYEQVARHYGDNGFFLKALAVYKQMQKVDAERPEIYQRLAELNVKQGLIGNALTELRNLLNLYRRQGELEEVVKVLDQMKNLDPNNLGISLQLAEAYNQLQDQEKAAACLIEILHCVVPSGDVKALDKIQQVGLVCCPESASFKVELSRGQLACGQTASAVELLQEILQGASLHSDALLLLAEAHRAQGDHALEIATYGRLLEADADNLDWRMGYAGALLSGGEMERALVELEPLKEGFFAAGRAADLKDIYESILEQLPDNEQAVASLHAIYEQTGEGGKLFDLMSSAQEDQPALKGAGTEPSGTQEADGFGELDLEDELFSETEGKQHKSADLDSESTITAEQDSRREALQGGLEFDDLDLDGIEFGLETEGFSDNDLPEETLSTEVSAGQSAPIDVSAEIEEAEFYFQQGLFAEAAQKCRSLIERTQGCPQAQQILDKIGGDAGASGQVVLKTKGSETTSSKVSGSLQGLEDREQSRLDGSFSEFKKGLEHQVAAEDTETHYNLGIAYKEMGLLDDAISQFNKVMVDPQRRIDCLTLKGVCLVQKGAFDEAVLTFKEGLSYEKLKDCERISLYYELGLLYIEWKQPLEALDSFQCVADADPFFRNVDEQIRQLRKQLGLDDDNDESPSGGGSDKNRVSYI